MGMGTTGESEDSLIGWMRDLAVEQAGDYDDDEGQKSLEGYALAQSISDAGALHVWRDGHL
jgi:hypothetical protein